MLSHTNRCQLSPHILCIISIIQRIQYISRTMPEKADDLSQFRLGNYNEERKKQDFDQFEHVNNYKQTYLKILMIYDINRSGAVKKRIKFKDSLIFIQIIFLYIIARISSSSQYCHYQLQQRQRQKFEFRQMDFTNGPIEMPDIDYNQLQQPPALDQQLLNTLDENIKSTNWIQSHHCITMVRQIVKYHANFTNDIINRYSNAFVDLFVNGKTQIIKNLLRMVKEIFDMGKDNNVQKAVYLFLPILLKKSSTDLGHIKQMSQQALTSFSNNCGYDISFVIASGYCCDKSTLISEISVKLLARLVENIGGSLIHLTPDTLQNMMKNLYGLIDGKRQNLKNQGLDICLYIYNLIGSENYLSLMNYSLKPEEINIMGNSMEQHRTSKQKPVPLANILRERKSMMPQQNNNEINYYR